MGEVQSVVASAPALTSPAPIGTSVNTPQVMLTAVKLRDSAWVNVAKPGENTYSGLNVTWYSVPGSKPPWLQNPSVFVWTDAGSAPVPLTRPKEIGRASCRERASDSVAAAPLAKQRDGLAGVR